VKKWRKEKFQVGKSVAIGVIGVHQSPVKLVEMGFANFVERTEGGQHGK